MPQKTHFEKLLFCRGGNLYLDWGSYIISIVKTASKKIRALIRSMKFFSPEVALYFYKSTVYKCKEYCCLVWAGAPSYYWEQFRQATKTDTLDCSSFSCCFA